VGWIRWQEQEKLTGLKRRQNLEIWAPLVKAGSTSRAENFVGKE
jgi:hypothetical protein